MIGKPEWFTRRKYGGWGLQPRTWQGWVYILVFAIPIILINSLPSIAVKTRIIAIAIWAAILILDVFHIMTTLKQDEREKIHEALAERNALWGIIVVITAGVLYESISSALNQTFQVNPFLIAALVVGLIIKSISNIYLDRKN